MSSEFSPKIAPLEMLKLWYTFLMNDESLIKTNPYLKDPAQRKIMFMTAVLASTAVEGVHFTDINPLDMKKERKQPPTKKTS